MFGPVRFAAFDFCAEELLVALQHFDDVVAPASSAEQLRQIWKALETFTSLHGSRFNIGPRKSAVLPTGLWEEAFPEGTFSYFGTPIPTLVSGWINIFLSSIT